MARIEEHEVRFIVLDDIHTWMGYSLESFPQLAALVTRQLRTRNASLSGRGPSQPRLRGPLRARS